jgi:hypothetical protein
MVNINIKTLIVAAILAVGGILVLFWYFQSDEARIKKQFTTIAKLASRSGEEHELTAAVAAKKIGDMFADTCVIEIPSYRISRVYAKKDLPGHVMGARSRYTDISLDFHDIIIDFPEEETAQVTLTAYVEAVWLSGQSVREVHEIACRLEKVERDWFFHQIEVVTVLEK